MSERNQLILPQVESKRLVCPKCGCKDWTARNVGGVYTFTCKNVECKVQWQGGLPMQMIDPISPHPPLAPTNPSATFVRPLKKGTDKWVEQRKRPDLSQDFRKGAPIPDEEE